MSVQKGSSTSVLAGRRVLLGVTGGIAAYKACVLVRLLTAAGAGVQVVMTRAATRFVGPDTFAALSGRPAYTDLSQEEGSVLHVRLAHEADVAVVAPATANTLAKLALGFADDLLSSTFLEASCPMIVAPAMHTGMYESPTTQENLRLLAERRVKLVGPVVGLLAAGDEGAGRMAEPEEIFTEIAATVGRGMDLVGRKILVTAGPTWEPLDPVRFIGNRSTGKMGFAAAAEAASRGADVTLVVGPGTVAPPPGVRLVRVMTAAEMREAVMEDLQASDAVVMAAAVADFKPEIAGTTKLKKERGAPDVRLVPTPDILLEVTSAVREDQYVVGFAAETEDLEMWGRSKLESKGVDLMVANRVGAEGTGFGADTNEAAIYARSGDDEPLRTWTKHELARAICDRIGKALAAGPLL